MVLYEIDRNDYRDLGIKTVIERELYCVRDNSFVRNAFNFHKGTAKHMNEYMKNNKAYCVWYNPETGAMATKWE